eukprot:gnl/TRDRNA2_/TRDRNA2_178021_c0_seq1.p1 gnl/TRDRNA2_/TRDRNA2_178021_c0~~gnl/TRDRNA2_/TRDRNA2_178021_c0_seq1.p1  ORF type:complete len:770 (+),score=-41.65 gnl/TRDRNA2_/TRDRNA2_178021_c0_seq1:444-2753(+)
MKNLQSCKKITYCPHCHELNGLVKFYSNSLKIIHDKFVKNTKATISSDKKLIDLEDKKTEVIDSFCTLHLFKKVSLGEFELLNLKKWPENLIITYIPVPPMCIRPIKDINTGYSDDKLTKKLNEILEINHFINIAINMGLPVKSVMEEWFQLQSFCAMYINSDTSGITSLFKGFEKPSYGLLQRLKGKNGRFRGNLCGKRVDFTGRTVISPDPIICIDEVCIPQQMAIVFTYPENVTEHNKNKLRKSVINGMYLHPGANNVLISEIGGKCFLKFGDRLKLANKLKIGDTIERHICKNDIVLFNRQPSLHRQSFMAFKAKIFSSKTYRLNECACNPFNADFDGDEMNIHIPQTEEARSESLSLVNILSNLRTPKNGEILVSAIQDFITACYIISSKDEFIPREELCRFCGFMTDSYDRIDLPYPTIIKPKECWTGKQIFGMMIRPNKKVQIFINLELQEKFCEKNIENMCLRDGYVFFLKSEHISGRLGKMSLGNGNNTGLFSVLIDEYGTTISAICINRIAKLASRFISRKGFSIGVDDLLAPMSLERKKREIVMSSYDECKLFIQQFKYVVLNLDYKSNRILEFESNVTKILNKVREKICMSTLRVQNTTLIMSSCGSKGASLNISQMVFCVGQQTVNGRRIYNGFQSRTLPHFHIGEISACEKGFVIHSFCDGLNPLEFWFHTMGGREGLVDTAVKTAETGYMSRRLMKALENFFCSYDQTSRDPGDNILQLMYGDDSLDPILMEDFKGLPLNNKQFIMNAHLLDSL